MFIYYISFYWQPITCWIGQKLCTFWTGNQHTSYSCTEERSH